MTDEDIRRLTAEKVMGWHQRPQKSVSRPDDPDNPVWCDETGYYQEHVSKWDPLTNAAHADRVLDKMADRGFDCTIAVRMYDGDPRCWVNFDSLIDPRQSATCNGNSANAAARHRALCEAALRAVAGE